MSENGQAFVLLHWSAEIVKNFHDCYCECFGRSEENDTTETGESVLLAVKSQRPLSKSCSRMYICIYIPIFGQKSHISDQCYQKSPLWAGQQPLRLMRHCTIPLWVGLCVKGKINLGGGEDSSNLSHFDFFKKMKADSFFLRSIFCQDMTFRL